jgi:hypothetical protein
MDNHLHLVLRRVERPLGLLMQRLLTGYSSRFNLRHRRTGHLFQNRYKSILCQEDTYLLELVRYVHLNPVRARMVGDPARYRWSSDRAYLNPRPPPWLDTATVLTTLGGRAAYRRFVTVAASHGRRPDLNGEASSDPDVESRRWLGGRVLESKRFVRSIVRRARRDEMERGIGRYEMVPMAALGSRVARQFAIRESRLRSASRTARVSRARRALVLAAVIEHGWRPIDVSRYLRISTSAVAQHLRALEAAT